MPPKKASKKAKKPTAKSARKAPKSKAASMKKASSTKKRARSPSATDNEADEESEGIFTKRAKKLFVEEPTKALASEDTPPKAESRSTNGTESPAPLVEKKPLTDMTGPIDMLSRDYEGFQVAYANGTTDFDKIWEVANDLQARDMLIGRFNVPPYKSRRVGVFETVEMRDPKTNEVYTFQLTEISVREKPAPTLKCKIIDRGCGVSASGSLRMHRCWCKADDDGAVMEIFKGVFRVEMSYNSLHKRKRKGKEKDCELTFWAIRARKDESGKDIGLELLEVE